ncbi:hypothetical protein HMSSN139_20370 [Paenibacillus sp. HMSSN-139]|nr:hypothetical protein HMSSN139_20370 [Paenibacillus sp. HMSSN-139]
MDQTINLSGQGMPIRNPAAGSGTAQSEPTGAPHAVYIHIPFCTNKCFYCDFNSYVLKDQPVMDYLRALDREMELTVQQTPPSEIRSIFVGGGTPTVLNPQEMEFSWLRSGAIFRNGPVISNLRWKRIRERRTGTN